MPRGRTETTYRSPIPAGDPSRSAYNVTQPSTTPPPSNWTIYYYCKLHPDIEKQSAGDRSYSASNNLRRRDARQSSVGLRDFSGSPAIEP